MRSTLRLFAAAFLAMVIFSGAVPAVGAVGVEGDANGSLRHTLLADGKVERLYSIDEYHTYVVSRGPAPGVEAVHGVTLVKLVEDGPLVTSVIRHDTPEPLLFKSEALAGAGGLTGLPAGEIKLRPSGHGDSGDDALYTAADLYQHAYSACVSTGGAPAFVVPKRHGGFKRLTEVSALKAFVYMVDPGQGGQGTWYIACAGDERFVVEKRYPFLSGGADVAVVALRRGLEGVSYVQDTGSDTVSHARRAAQAVEPSEDFLREMAIEVARLKGRLVKVKGGSRFSGVYTRPSGRQECGKVSIKRTWDTPDVERTLVKVYDFKLCKNKLESLGESVHEGSVSLEGRLAGLSPR